MHNMNLDLPHIIYHFVENIEKSDILVFPMSNIVILFSYIKSDAS